MTYQGFLTDASGTPRTGTISLSFELFSDSIAGTTLWSEDHAAVPVEGGVFVVRLGSANPLPASIFTGARLWLATTVNDTILSPRRPIGAVAYAFRADIADSAARSALGASIDGAEIEDGAITNADIAPNAAIGGGKVLPDFGAQTIRTTADVEAGTARVTGFEMPPGAALGRVLTSNASGIASWQLPAATGVGGSGSAGNLAIFTAPATLSSSSVLESAGNVGIGAGSPSGRLHVRGQSSSDPVLVAQGAAGQSANLQEWRNDAGSAVASVSSTGTFSGVGSSLTNLTASSIATGNLNSARLPSSGTWALASSFNIQASAGNLLGFDTNQARVGVGTTTPQAKLHVVPVNPTTRPLVVQAQTGQTANLQEWVSSSGAPLGSVSSAGVFAINGSGIANLNATMLTTGSVPSPRLSGTYSQFLAFTNTSNAFFGDGSNLTFLNASNISSGTLASARLPNGGNWSLGSTLAFDGTTLAVDPLSDRVGIGTTTPDSHLDVFGRIEFGTGSRGGILTSTASDNFQLRTFTDTPNPNFEIAIGDGSGASLYTWLSGGSNSLQILPEGGFVGIGTTNATNILTVAQGFSTNPIAGAWTTYSSRRWKKDVTTLEDALGLVEKLRGVRYTWKESGKRDLGLIAEEVGQVVPEVVEYEANGEDARSVDYARLTAVLIEAVKQLRQEVVSLRSRIEQMERAPGFSAAR